MAEVGTWQWLRDLLRGYGLEDLFDIARNGVTEGASEGEVYEVLREQPTFRSRFSAMFERESRGLPPVTPGQIIEQERQLRQLAAFYGYELDPGESWQEVANRTMAQDISVNEMQVRLAAYRDLADRIMGDPANQQVVDELLQQGATPIDLARMVVEPDAGPKIEQRIRAAAIGLEANRFGRGLTPDQADRLAQQGMTGEEAEQGFGTLARNAQVIDGITGEIGGGVDTETELAAISGDATAQARIEQQRRRRTAAFQGGGGFATDDEGFGGLR